MDICRLSSSMAMASHLVGVSRWAYIERRTLPSSGARVSLLAKTTDFETGAGAPRRMCWIAFYSRVLTRQRRPSSQAMMTRLERGRTRLISGE